MSSYTIPEEVIGVPLFVPEDYDQFSVESAGLPNGDDCLVVHGDVDSKYMAFQPAQAITPTIFTNRGTNNGSAPTWAVSFWYKTTSVAAGSGNSHGTLFGVMNVADNPSGWSNGLKGSVGQRLWWVRQNGAAVGAVWSRGSATLDDAGVVNTPAAIVANQWHLIVLNMAMSGATGEAGGYLDNDATTGSRSTATSGTATITNGYFVLGAYGVSANSIANDREWRIGKLAFHDHWLNQTERAILYNSMMGA